jgi:hypothetical protein
MVTLPVQIANAGPAMAKAPAIASGLMMGFMMISRELVDDL